MTLGNLTFDENVCLHRTMIGKPNLYRDAVNTLTEIFKLISISQIISFGAGAKIIPKLTDTSKCFAFSKDLFNPFH